jgi:hypothetical protein
MGFQKDIMVETNVANIEGWPIDMVKAHLKDHGTKKDARVKIIDTIKTYNKIVLSKPEEGTPCECGSSMFIRTGTCHVCTICGTSQGCS